MQPLPPFCPSKGQEVFGWQRRLRSRLASPLAQGSNASGFAVVAPSATLASSMPAVSLVGAGTTGVAFTADGTPPGSCASTIAGLAASASAFAITPAGPMLVAASAPLAPAPPPHPPRKQRLSTLQTRPPTRNAHSASTALANPPINSVLPS